MRMKYKDIEWMKIEIEVKGLKIGIWIDEGFEEKVGGGKKWRSGRRRKNVWRWRRDNREGGEINK